jgi:hypothetical protein
MRRVIYINDDQRLLGRPVSLAGCQLCCKSIYKQLSHMLIIIIISVTYAVITAYVYQGVAHELDTRWQQTNTFGKQQYIGQPPLRVTVRPPHSPNRVTLCHTNPKLDS